MKSKDFEKFLRKVIREEIKPMIEKSVNKAVAKQFKLLREALLTPEPSIEKRQYTSGRNGNTQETLMQESQKVENGEQKRVFNDSPFASILNQTATQSGGISQDKNKNPSFDQQTVELRQTMTEQLGYGDFGSTQKPSQVSIPKTSASGKRVDPNKIPDFLVNAMNKNYSDVIKKGEEITKRRRGEL